jgi:hypothetical protein
MAGNDQGKAPASIRSVVILSSLAGMVIASLLPLLVNVWRLEWTALLLLYPGGLLTSLIAPGKLVPHPLFLLVANAIFYAMVFFLLSLVFRRSLTASRVRTGGRILAILAAGLFALACVPQLNPFWPHGLDQLATRETEIRGLIHSDMTIDQVRAALQRESMPVNEETEDSPREILRNGNTTILAAAGDRVLSSRFRTDATQYPCGYDLEVLVLFGTDGKIKNRYVAPLPICP